MKTTNNYPDNDHKSIICGSRAALSQWRALTGTETKQKKSTDNCVSEARHVHEPQADQLRHFWFGKKKQKSERDSLSLSSATGVAAAVAAAGLLPGRGADCQHNARHMENRRISHGLPARAKANTNPHMHRSGHLGPPPFTITTDETQESFCFLFGPLLAGLTSFWAGPIWGRINLGAQVLV